MQAILKPPSSITVAQSNFMPQLEILFEDRDILVVCKPAGLATQAPAVFDSLEARVRTHLMAEEKPYLGIPHRLDRCVSGTIVFAKRRKAAQRLSKQFEERTVDKRYRAIVEGMVSPVSDTWTDYLRKLPNEPRGEVVSENDLAQYPEAKQAILRYKVLNTDNQQEVTELSIQLETGRMHQIRLQTSVRDHPVWGDIMYGSNTEFASPPEHERERQIALHAEELTFEHPRSRDRVRFVSPLPITWPSSWSA